MADADLEGVVVEPSDQCACAALVLLLENLKQRVAVCQTLFLVCSLLGRDPQLPCQEAGSGDGERRSLGCRQVESAETAEAERVFQIGAPRVGRAALVVRDGDLFPALMNRIA